MFLGVLVLPPMSQLITEDLLFEAINGMTGVIWEHTVVPRVGAYWVYSTSVIYNFEA